MKSGKAFAAIFLTATTIMLPGCERVMPADETQMEQPAAIIELTANPDAGTDEPEKEFIAIYTDEQENSIAPAQVLSAQETSPPTKVDQPVSTPTARTIETKSTAATAAPVAVTATPSPTAEPAPVVAADTVPTVTPEPTEPPKPTAIPKPTATPQMTSAPKTTTAPVVTATPRPTATPAPVATPKPTASPTPTPVPTAAPHVHNWTKHEATGHYESQKTGTEEVAVGTYWEEIGGWDENHAAYYKCNDCGAEFSSNLEAGDHILSVYHSSYSYYPAELIHHDGEWVERTRYETRDVYEDVWIVDSEAYWTCACGETRYSQP